MEWRLPWETLKRQFWKWSQLCIADGESFFNSGNWLDLLRTLVQWCGRCSDWNSLEYTCLVFLSRAGAHLSLPPSSPKHWDSSLSLVPIHGTATIPCVLPLGVWEPQQLHTRRLCETEGGGPVILYFFLVKSTANHVRQKNQHQKLYWQTFTW